MQSEVQPVRRFSSLRLPLARPWGDADEPAFRPGEVHLRWNPEALLVDAELVDDCVVTEARKDNDRLWELGDLFEIFVRVEGRTEYTELHIAPGNIRLHLALPGPRGYRTPLGPPVPFEEMLVWPVGFESSTGRTETGWTAQALVPARILGKDAFLPGDRLHVSFCRYDATPGRPPVLSSTTSHPVMDFHRLDEWTRIELTAGTQD